MSSAFWWYTQLDRRRFVYDTYKKINATRMRHCWVHMFTTHRPTLTLQLHNFDLFRTCRTALLRGNWQDFNWHDASRGPSAIAELLIGSVRQIELTNVSFLAHIKKASRIVSYRIAKTLRLDNMHTKKSLLKLAKTTCTFMRKFVPKKYLYMHVAFKLR